LPVNLSLIESLKTDHRTLERMLGDIESTPDEELQDFFCEIRHELVRHEVAEEVVLYPALRRLGPKASEIADACVAEQATAEEELASMEKMQEDPLLLRPLLLRLRAAVIEHAVHEETEALPPLAKELSDDELAELGARYQTSLAAAPTHPHPHIPNSPLANVLIGPLAALVDTVRDAMRGAA
jgi:hypothetical protein